MIEYIDNYYFLRLDKQNFGNYGDKSRLAYSLCQNQNGIITCGSRESIQTVAFAEMCDKLNIHIPQGKETESIIKLNNTKANIVREKIGYNNVLNARAKEDSEINNYKFIQLGMLCEEAYDLISENVKYIIPYKDKINNIICPVGSGTTLIGLVKGLRKYNINIKVIGIMCGMDATKNISKALNGDLSNIQLIKSDLDYHKNADNLFCGIELNPTYEAKCIPYIKDNDLLYIVSR